MNNNETFSSVQERFAMIKFVVNLDWYLSADDGDCYHYRDHEYNWDGLYLIIMIAFWLWLSVWVGWLVHDYDDQYIIMLMSI